MRKLMFQRGILFAIFAFFAAVALGATEYYTWIDEHGITNYAQRSPDGYNAQFIGSVRAFGYQQQSRRPQALPRNSGGAASKPSGQTDPEISITAERDAIVKQIAAAKRSNCEMGKRNLAKLEAFRKIRVRDESGGEKFLSDAEKAQRIDETRQIIRENCTG